MAEIYMIFNANGGDIPRIRHEALGDARKEAKRLAQKEPNANFYILKVVESVRMSWNPFEITVY